MKEFLMQIEKAEAEIIKLKEYEVEQFKKAFADGTDEAWKKYRANIKRRANKIKKAYDFVKIDLDYIMS